MPIDFKSFATDENKENDGVWINLGPTSRVKLGRIGSRRFKDRQIIKMKPYEALSRLGQVPPEVQERVTVELVAETVLLGWEGFTEDGVDVPYSYENALRVLMENKQFLEFICEQAMLNENYRPDRKDTEKNFVSASTGN